MFVHTLCTLFYSPHQPGRFKIRINIDDKISHSDENITTTLHQRYFTTLICNQKTTYLQRCSNVAY